MLEGNPPRPPTPQEVLDQLVNQFVPETSRTWGSDQVLAKQNLAIRMLVYAFGVDSPISQFCLAYHKSQNLLFPMLLCDDKLDAAEEELNKMEATWEAIQEDTIKTIEGYRGE